MARFEQRGAGQVLRAGEERASVAHADVPGLVDEGQLRPGQVAFTYVPEKCPKMEKLTLNNVQLVGWPTRIWASLRELTITGLAGNEYFKGIYEYTFLPLQICSTLRFGTNSGMAYILDGMSDCAGLLGSTSLREDRPTTHFKPKPYPFRRH